jgi:hypothetical protein
MRGDDKGDGKGDNPNPGDLCAPEEGPHPPLLADLIKAVILTPSQDTRGQVDAKTDSPDHLQGAQYNLSREVVTGPKKAHKCKDEESERSGKISYLLN